MTPEPLPDEPPASLLARTRARALATADVAELRLRRLVRKQLDAARSSDNPVRRRAYVGVRQAGRRAVNAVTGRQLGWMATLWAARWLDGTRYEITGWAYERGYGYEDPPRTRVFLTDARGTDTIEASVRMVADMEVNGLTRRAEHDYANTAFVATFDLAPLLTAPTDEPWQVRVEVTGPDGDVRRGSLKLRHRLGSAALPAARTFEDGSALVPSWWRRRGLFLSREAAGVVARAITFQGRSVLLELDPGTVAVERAELVSPQAIRPLQLSPQPGGGLLARGDLPTTWVLDGSEALAGADVELDEDQGGELRESAGTGIDEADPEDATEEADGTQEAADPAHEGQHVALQVYRVAVVDTAGEQSFVTCTLDRTGSLLDPSTGLTAYPVGQARLAISDARGTLLVEDARLDHGERPGLRVTGRSGGDVAGIRLVMEGRRQQLQAELTTHEDGRWEAAVPLHQSQWGGPECLPRTGSYTLRALREGGPQVRVMCTDELIARTPERLDVPETRMRLETGRGRRLRLRVGVSRRADELGSFHQRRMEAEFLDPEARHEPARAVYFESFYGRLATCNPYAIDRVVARDHPDWVRYWGVTDLSVPVPEGAVPVVEGTREWFEARSTARYVVANDWLRRRFVPQPFQTVLQTWHGSMFKRIGLDRPMVKASTRESLLREKAKWDILLSQNAHSTEIFGSAYAWDGELYEEGYPRNDELVHGSGEDLRRRLGIRPDQKVILYAPTWRDDVPGLVVFLDLAELARELGDDHVILLRGHSRTVGHGRSVSVPGVIDVSTYPSITELFLAADAMITDYSSVMFDYSVTRRPMIFFVPDLDSYKDEIRGVYFDLAELAPGPVVTTQAEVVEAVRAMDDQEPWAARYAEWVERFNAHDDGHSAERVVRRLFASEPPPR